MNAQDHYRRRLDRFGPPTGGMPSTATERASQVGDSNPGVAWIRPSDLTAAVGALWVRRGLDVHAEMTRQVRRTPVTAARGAQRVTRSALAKPTQSTGRVATGPSIEEVGL